MAMCFLVVDDSPHFLAAARALLERDLSLVTFASNTTEALRRVGDIRPDVVLVDVYLGTESGIDLARRLRSETDMNPARVILISAHPEEDLADMIGAPPVAAFLSKSRLSTRAIHEILGQSSYS